MEIRFEYQQINLRAHSNCSLDSVFKDAKKEKENLGKCTCSITLLAPIIPLLSQADNRACRETFRETNEDKLPNMKLENNGNEAQPAIQHKSF